MGRDGSHPMEVYLYHSASRAVHLLLLTYLYVLKHILQTTFRPSRDPRYRYSDPYIYNYPPTSQSPTTKSPLLLPLLTLLSLLHLSSAVGNAILIHHCDFPVWCARVRGYFPSDPVSPSTLIVPGFEMCQKAVVESKTEYLSFGQAVSPSSLLPSSYPSHLFSVHTGLS